MSGFDEVIDGVLHWQAQHPRIGQQVHSYYLPFQRLVIDPIGSEGLIDELSEQGGVERIVLTNRHHLRAGEQLAEAFGCPVYAPLPGMHAFESQQNVRGYEWGDQLSSGVTAHEVGAICPDDGALHITTGPGALALADGLISWEGRLAFVPDALMDQPETVKREQLAAVERLLELEFEAVLLAHGMPIRSAGKAALERFLAEPYQADFEV